MEFLEDRTLLAITAVSTAAPGLISDTGSGASQLTQTGASSLSADGRYVVFTSTSENLVPGQTPLGPGMNVFLRDQVTGTTTLVSHQAGSPDARGDGASNSPTISADGRYIVYVSYADDLVPRQVEPTGPTAPLQIFLYDQETGLNTLISHIAGVSTTGGSGDSTNPVISADGSTIAFLSTTTNLVAGQTQPAGSAQIFLYSVATGTTTLVTHAFNSTTTASGSVDVPTNLALSSNGRFLAYDSYGTNLVGGQVDSGSDGNDVFLYDQTSNASTLVSHNSGSNVTVGDDASYGASISADGSSIAFISDATDLVVGQGDTSQSPDVFLYSAATGNITLVSHVAGSPTTATGNCWTAVISADASTIVYTGMASNILAGQTGPTNDLVFLYDCSTGLNTLVSHAADNPQSGSNALPPPTLPDEQFMLPAVSADGSYVVYLVIGTDLISNPSSSSGNPGDVYLYDRTTGSNTLLGPSPPESAMMASAFTGHVAISSDGLTVAFESPMGNLPTGLLDNNLNWDVFLYGTASGQLSVASVRDPSEPELTANADSTDIPVTPQMVSSDGRYVLITSAATNLVEGQIEQNAGGDIFLADRATGITYLVSHIPGSDVTTMASPSTYAVLSENGEFVAFVNGGEIYLYDLATQDVTLITHPAGSPNTPTVTGASSSPVISADGQYVAYLSGASDLVPGFVDNDGGNQDVFLYDAQTGTNVLVSHTADSASTTVDQSTGAPNISADGSTVAFGSFAKDVVSGQLPGSNNADLFAYNVATGTSVMVSHAYNSTVQGVGFLGPVVMSDDGSTIVYLDSSNLLVGDPLALGYMNVVLYNRATGLNQLVTQGIDPANTLANGDSWDETISGDGQTIYFDSSATNLVAGFIQGNTTPDVYAYDRTTGTISLISHSDASATTASNFTSTDPETTEDGNLVIFRSEATDLIPGFTKVDGAGAYDLYLYNRQTGITTLLSHTMASLTTSPNDGVTWATISADGSTIPFGSDATDLVPGDFNSTVDVFTSSGNLAPPPPVSGLTTTSSNGSVTLSWTAVPGVYGYDVYRTPVASPSVAVEASSLLAAPLAAAAADPESTTDGDGTILVQAAVDGTSFTDTGLTNGAEYSYEVTAVNSAGESNTSAEVSATPNASADVPVSLAGVFNRVGIVADGSTFTGGLDGVGYAYSANLLGSSATWNGATFALGAPNTKNVVSAAGQTIALPTGNYSALSFLATGVNGNQPNQSFTVTYTDGSTQTFTQSMSDWFTPQNYAGEAKALSMAYRDTAAGAKDNRTFNLYAYSFALNTGKTVQSLTLPNNANVEMLGVTLLQSPLQPPSPPTGLQATAGSGQVTLAWTASAGAASYNIYRGTTSGLESPTPVEMGVTSTSWTDTGVSNGTAYYYEITAVNAAGESARSSEASATPQASVAGPVSVSLSGVFDRTGIVTDGSTFTGGLDGVGYAYSANLVGASLTWNGNTFALGTPNAKNVVSASGQTITLPAESYSALNFLATGVNGNQANQIFTVKYTDGSTQTFTQSISDWFTPQSYPGESKVATMAYRDTSTGSQDHRTFNLYGYSFALNSSKTVQSITLPNDPNVVLLSALLTPVAPINTAVNLSGSFNREGIVSDGSTFTSGLDGVGYALSAQLLGSSVNWNNQTFNLGAANTSNVVSAYRQTIQLPAGSYSTLSFLATAVNGNQVNQSFTVTYTDGTTQTFTQSISDWFTPQKYSGESTTLAMAYRDTSAGGKDSRTFNLYGYSFALNSSKTVQSITLPNDPNLVVLAIDLR